MSIRTRKSLDEIAAQVNAVRKASNPETKELPVKDALVYDLNAKWAVFERFMDKPRTEEEVAQALSPVRAALNIVNDEVRMERLESMQKMAFKEAFLDYMRTQCVTGYRVKTEGETYLLDGEASVYLDAYDVVSALYTADLNGIIDSCCIFADNVARFAIGEDASISKNSLHQSYIDLRNRKGWNVPKSKLSKSVLAEQMTEICKFISGGISPKMLNPDVTFVLNGIIQAKDEADSAGKFVKRDERTVVRFIFRALYTRYNNLAYSFQDTTRASKGALGAKNNKAMAEPPAEKEDMPDAGPVTSDVPEKTTAETTVETAAPKTKEPAIVTKVKKTGNTAVGLMKDDKVVMVVIGKNVISNKDAVNVKKMLEMGYTMETMNITDDQEAIQNTMKKIGK